MADPAAPPAAAAAGAPAAAGEVEFNASVDVINLSHVNSLAVFIESVKSQSGAKFFRSQYGRSFLNPKRYVVLLWDCASVVLAWEKDMSNSS